MLRKILYIANVRYKATEDINRIMLLKLNWLVEHTDYDCYWLMTDKQERQVVQSKLLMPEVHIIRINVRNNQTVEQMTRVEQLVRSWKWGREYRAKLVKALDKFKPDIVITTLKHQDDILSVPNRERDGIVEVLTDDEQIFCSEEKIRTSFGHLMEYIWRKFRMSIITSKLKRMRMLVVPTVELVDKWKMDSSGIVHIPQPLADIPDTLPDSAARQVISIGTFDSHSQGNFERLLEGWKHLSMLYPEWKLRIYGNGDASPYIDLVKKLKLSKSVCCSPIPQNLDIVYRQASIYMQNVGIDIQGHRLVEAMSYGLPCIAFDVPYAPKEIISDGVNGFLSPIGHNLDFITKLGLIIRKVELRKKMSEEACKTSAKYHIDNIMRQWTNIFDNMISSKEKKRVCK